MRRSTADYTARGTLVPQKADCLPAPGCQHHGRAGEDGAHDLYSGCDRRALPAYAKTGSDFVSALRFYTKKAICPSGHMLAEWILAAQPLRSKFESRIFYQWELFPLASLFTDRRTY